MRNYVCILSVGMGFTILAVPSAAGPLEDLKSPDPMKRAAAATTLGAMLSDHARPTVDALRPLLKDKEPGVRSNAAQALAQIGPAAKDAVHELIPNLFHEQNGVRRSVCFALQAIGPAAKAAVPALIEALNGPEVTAESDVEYDRVQVIQALRSIGPGAKAAVPALHAILKDAKQTQKLRIHAASALAEIGIANPEVMATLMELLRNTADLNMASAAAGVVGGIGYEAREAIPLLLALYRSQGNTNTQWANQIRQGALDALRHMGPAAKPVVPELVRILKDKQVDSGVRKSAALALKHIGPHAIDAVPTLLDMVKNYDPVYSRDEIVYALGGIGPAAIPALVEFINNEANKKDDRNPRSVAVRAIGEMGPAAKSAIPFLSGLLEDAQVATRAREALHRITHYSGRER